MTKIIWKTKDDLVCVELSHDMNIDYVYKNYANRKRSCLDNSLLTFDPKMSFEKIQPLEVREYRLGKIKTKNGFWVESFEMEEI